MATKFQRKTFVTRGPDPTEVVTWYNGDITLTEFQTVIQIESTEAVASNLPESMVANELIQKLGEALHAALERAYTAEQELRDAIEANQETLSDFQ